MNTVSTRRHIAPFVLSILLLAAIPVCLCRAMETDANIEAAKTNVLIGPDGKIKLRILLTTSSNEERTADFVSFLSKHFIKVETTDYKSFREELAEDFDVVIIDYDATRPGAPTPELTPEYSHATITIGVAGSMVCRRLNLKPGYL